MSVGHEQRFARSSLGRVLGDLGVTLLEVVCGRIDETQTIGGVIIYDPVDEPLYPDHAIVLGVSVRDAGDLAEMIEALEGHTPSAVVVRSPVALSDEVREAAERCGLVVLGLARGATWTQLAALLRSLLAEDDVGERHVTATGGIPSGDLFAVANAISALLDAPVTIEDRSSRVLAFSGGQEFTDLGRTETIIGRRVPPRYTQALTERGVFRDLYRSSRPVVVEAIQFDDERSMQRVAIAVRAGDEILGSLWAAMDGSLSEDQAHAFLDAAKLVALHLLRARAGADVQRRLHAELVSTALEGGSEAREALGRLNLAGQPVCVVAAVLDGSEGQNSPEPDQAMLLERERFADAFAVHLTAFRPGAAVAPLGEGVYGILPAANDQDCDRVVQTMENFLDRIGSRMTAAIAVGPAASDMAGIARSRSVARRVLRALHEPGPGAPKKASRVARLADVQAIVLTLELKDLMVFRGDEPAGPLSKIVEHDRDQGSALTDTVRAWFDHFGDVRQAAAALFVHQNTFRYRLRKAVQISGIDLGDPDERFAAMLHLRLLDR